jgi:hypothetical protein
VSFSNIRYCDPTFTGSQSAGIVKQTPFQPIFRQDRGVVFEKVVIQLDDCS